MRIPSLLSKFGYEAIGEVLGCRNDFGGDSIEHVIGGLESFSKSLFTWLLQRGFEVFFGDCVGIAQGRGVRNTRTGTDIMRQSPDDITEDDIMDSSWERSSETAARASASAVAGAGGASDTTRVAPANSSS